tara:strand:+ start:164 stop:1636 length:1473 start_codon:yes stop_codon:yes gene_type:complete
MKKRILVLISTFYLITSAVAQTDTSFSTNSILSGTILNEKNAPLPYVNIISMNTGKGTISNKSGGFSININSLNNTIRFQCIGYKTKNYNIENLKNNSIILLSENIYDLDEILIINTTQDPEEIVRNILKNKNLNYKNITKKEQVFIRKRNMADMLKLKLNYNKNTISEITPEMVQLVEKNIPKHNQSYSDLLTDIYIKESELKFNPIKIVELKKDDNEELKSIGETFEKLIKDTKKDEFWRVKTGIIRQRLTKEDNDSLEIDSSNTISINPYKNDIQGYQDYATFKDKKQWEFLHKTNKYNFEIIGGTTVNSENVYVIDFSPKEKGLFIGRLYISIETSALIRADYEYAPNKLGDEMNMFGLGLAQTNFSGSIYFEKDINKYNLKYFSFQNTKKISVKRQIALQKMKKRLLINKKIKEIKIGVDMLMEINETIELLVIDQAKISDIVFDNFIEKEHVNVDYVNQFDKNLWKNYNIIEPTQKMKEYKKVK